MFPPALLRTFLAVAQTRSFTQASQRLGVRQSTVSQHVRKLEQLTSRPLFTRDTHSVALTPDGEAMVGFARSILEANERAASYFAGSQLRGRLRNLSASRCAMGQSRSQRCGIREADPFSPSPLACVPENPRRMHTSALAWIDSSLGGTGHALDPPQRDGHRPVATAAPPAWSSATPSADWARHRA
ncbi:LysR family transcriptional regulator [Saccharopolyspora spinosporotrichia]